MTFLKSLDRLRMTSSLYTSMVRTKICLTRMLLLTLELFTVLHSQSRLTTTIGTRSAVADQSTSTQSLVAGTLRTGLAAHGLRTISQRILSATQQKRKAHTFLNTSATLLFSQQQTAMLIITQQLVSTTGQQTLRVSTL